MTILPDLSLFMDHMQDERGKSAVQKQLEHDLL